MIKVNNVLTELKHQQFFGFKFAQTWTTPFALSNFLERHPDIRHIVELGTGAGALTIMFGMAMILRRSGRVLTYDIHCPPEYWFAAARGLPIIFQQKDAFSNLAQAQIMEFLYRERALVFCDNGNKIREMHLYVPLLKVGDYIMAHDWGTEIKAEHIEDLMGYVEYYDQDFFDRWSTKILSMRRI